MPLHCLHLGLWAKLSFKRHLKIKIFQLSCVWVKKMEALDKDVDLLIWVRLVCLLRIYNEGNILM